MARPSIQQRLAMVTPPLWTELAHIPAFMGDGWLPLWEAMAAYREQAIARHEPLTSRLVVTQAELADPSEPVLALLELLRLFDLLTIEES